MTWIWKRAVEDFLWLLSPVINQSECMNAPQPDLFDAPTGEELRDAGIQQAIDHAEEVEPGWKDQAYEHLERYINDYLPRLRLDEFMAEEARLWSHEQGLSRPPTARAWGGVFLKASKRGLIQKIGTRTVKNPAAHCANAAVWKVKQQ